MISVVGIGADGWDGLAPAARRAVLDAEQVIGSERQLALLPNDVPVRRAWPSPLHQLLDEILGAAGHTCVLASGDPMLHGIGATIARRTTDLKVHPHISAFSLACARLGWPAAEVELVNAVAHPLDVLGAVLQPGRRIVAYVTGADGASSAAKLLRERGFGASRFVVLEQLGADGETIRDTTADAFDGPADPLHAVAIDCVGTPGYPRTPGLPDDAFDSDGQITKRHVRAVTVAALQPMPGALLWDVGAGSGSIGIEWLRAERTARAIAIEARDDRVDRIIVNARRLGVPHLHVVHGAAPAALSGLPAPDVIFAGGGLTNDGVFDVCWNALGPGGRLVANAVTLETEQLVIAAHQLHGGSLIRIEIAHAEPIGGFTGWRPQMPVVQWSVTK